jgi:hypothetical protein
LTGPRFLLVMLRDEDLKKMAVQHPVNQDTGNNLNKFAGCWDAPGSKLADRTISMTPTGRYIDPSQDTKYEFK